MQANNWYKSILRQCLAYYYQSVIQIFIVQSCYVSLNYNTHISAYLNLLLSKMNINLILNEICLLPP